MCECVCEPGGSGLRPKPTKAYISAYGRCLKINTNCLSVCTRYNVHIIRYRDSILSELKCVGRRKGTRAHTHTNSFRIHHQINQHKHRHGDWMKRTLHSVASYLFLGKLPVVGFYCISVFVFCSFRGVLVDWHGVRSSLVVRHSVFMNSFTYCIVTFTQ